MCDIFWQKNMVVCEYDLVTKATVSLGEHYTNSPDKKTISTKSFNFFQKIVILVP